MIGCFNRSVLLTYGGVVCSLFGIWNLLDGTTDRNVEIAMVCLILAGICDLFDGVIARKCKRNETQKQFGAEIDSLADVISFLVFPAVLLYTVCRERPGVVLPMAAFYVLCGVDRLAWFNMTPPAADRSFRGVPVTYAALVIPCLYVLSPRPDILFPAAYWLLGVLFVLDVRVPKPKGTAYLLFAVLAVVVIFLLLR